MISYEHNMIFKRGKKIKAPNLIPAGGWLFANKRTKKNTPTLVKCIE